MRLAAVLDDNDELANDDDLDDDYLSDSDALLMAAEYIYQLTFPLFKQNLLGPLAMVSPIPNNLHHDQQDGNSKSMGAQILYSAYHILFGVQMSILGPRLILSVREHHAELVADFDDETGMSSIVFQERVHVPTSSTV
ncbi:uncharacterized protein HD556DRAFT_1440135 [Suillus plorans]|uniref:Uncharacterized protein n=1 Tax=Suillus plorans TaxID=116603 RepID=A0A9P7DMB4_9AGAM|nr:uncharacterized protein HD556DRAFT_1440135 [Suillus plorans]KAG1798428.1 hypothetical protein HD556DRAFT_1440135 [Suillus plorans]